MNNIIVSSSDENYAHLLIELFNSLDNLSKKYDFAVFDCGLKNETIKFFKSKNIQLIKPNWEFKIPSYKIRGRENLKIQFSRFYMDKYFPGYSNYIWLDSDTWINCENTFELYLQGAEKNGFSITPQVDRSYKRLVDIRWLFGFPKKVNSINYKNISKSISKTLGRKYAGYYTMNAGCFAYNFKFSGIDKLRSNLKLASAKGRIFGSDQVALALTHFEDNIDYELLPSYCNWLCETKLPKFCSKKKLFVEPYLPNHNIGIMHLAGMDEDRKKELIFHKIKTLDNNIIEKSLRYQK